MTSTYQRPVGSYKVEKRGRSWELSFWCDCTVGPHWHLIGIHDTKSAAERQIDGATI